MKKFTFLLLGMLTAVVTHAATVNWSAAIDTGLIDSSGAALAQGNYVRIGYFGTLNNAQVASNALTVSGVSTLDGDFHQFASTTVGFNTGQSASFQIGSSPLYLSLSGFVPNSQIYFWALKSTNNTSVATAVSTVTQTAIGEVPFANLAAWQFPASDVATAKTIDLSDLGNANRQIQAGTYVPGSSASLTPIFGSANHALQLATVVPEPSVLAFTALAALALVGSRRRRQE